MRTWFPRWSAAAGVPDVKEKLLTGYQAGDSTFQGPSGWLQPDAISEGRDGGEPSQGVSLLDGRRRTCRPSVRQMEALFMEQRAHGFDVWEEPFIRFAFPSWSTCTPIPFERGPEEGIDYDHWRIDRVFLLVPGAGYVGRLADNPSRSSRPGRSRPPSILTQSCRR